MSDRPTKKRVQDYEIMLTAPKKLFDSPTPTGTVLGDETLNIPGATKLTVSDWQELLTDVADVYDESFGLPMTTSRDVRAFAKAFPDLLSAAVQEATNKYDWLCTRIESGEIVQLRSSEWRFMGRDFGFRRYDTLDALVSAEMLKEKPDV